MAQKWPFHGSLCAAMSATVDQWTTTEKVGLVSRSCSEFEK